ncbi:MAG: hypothetical protein KDD33_09675 [Bdellovibrionales bacterium]|nr:hypothetical protein [Bdellovibrionales bacterium]
MKTLYHLWKPRAPWLLFAGLALTFCVSFESEAQVQIQIRSVPVFSRTPVRGNRCGQIFRMPTYEVQMLTSNPFSNQPPAAKAETLPASRRSALVDEWLENTLLEWQKSGHYKPEQIQFLREKEQNLDPERTSYHSTSYAGRFSGIRVFDGSDLPIIDSVTWGHIHARDPRTPIEKQYGIRFPERDLRKTAYLWELGLQSAPHFFIEGVRANFVQMARWLDSNYNMNGMAAFGQTSQVDNLNFAIYAIARPKLVGRFEALGFKKVIDEHSGKEIVFADGMHLIRMSGATLLNNFFWGKSVPETDSYSYTISETGEGSRLQRAQENAARMEGRRLYVMSPDQARHNLQLIYDHLLNLKQEHLLEAQRLAEYERKRTEAGGSPRQVIFLGQETKTRQWIEELFLVWHSLPEGLVAYPLWYYMRGQINFMLSLQNPSWTVDFAIQEIKNTGLVD